MDSDESLTGPINLGNPDEVTILELAELVIALTGSGSTITYEPLPPDDPRQRQPDIARRKVTLDGSRLHHCAKAWKGPSPISTTCFAEAISRPWGSCSSNCKNTTLSMANS
jgi:hypothetical protein